MGRQREHKRLVSHKREVATVQTRAGSTKQISRGPTKQISRGLTEQIAQQSGSRRGPTEQNSRGPSDLDDAPEVKRRVGEQQVEVLRRPTGEDVSPTPEDEDAPAHEDERLWPRQKKTGCSVAPC